MAVARAVGEEPVDTLSRARERRAAGKRMTPDSRCWCFSASSMPPAVSASWVMSLTNAAQVFVEIYGGDAGLGTFGQVLDEVHPKDVAVDGGLGGSAARLDDGEHGRAAKLGVLGEVVAALFGSHQCEDDCGELGLGLLDECRDEDVDRALVVGQRRVGAASAGRGGRRRSRTPRRGETLRCCGRSFDELYDLAVLDSLLA